MFKGKKMTVFSDRNTIFYKEISNGGNAFSSAEMKNGRNGEPHLDKWSKPKLSVGF